MRCPRAGYGPNGLSWPKPLQEDSGKAGLRRFQNVACPFLLAYVPQTQRDLRQRFRGILERRESQLVVEPRDFRELLQPVVQLDSLRIGIDICGIEVHRLAQVGKGSAFV